MDNGIIKITNILDAAGYKNELKYFSIARHFILDMFVPAWFPTLSLGTSLSVPALAVPHLPFYCGVLGCGNQGIFLSVSQNI